MIEAGQLRRWTYAGPGHGKIFVVVKHDPYPLMDGLSDDGWVIMETGKKPYWETSDLIEVSSEEVTQ
jgi:hypothetical protein